MSFLKKISMRAFGRPTGFLGKLGGKVMARMNKAMAEKAIVLLEIRPNNKVLEIGFGPGVGIELLNQSISSGWIAGIDPSEEMVRQAKARNSEAIEAGKVGLEKSSVESLPFEPSTFDKAMSINSMPFWPDAIEGLREIRRTLKPEGMIVIGFSYHSGQKKDVLPEILEEAGFEDIRLTEGEKYFFVCGRKEEGRNSVDKRLRR